MFRDRTFSLGTALMLAFGFILYASPTLIPLFVQTLLGCSAFQSGVVISPRGLGVMATMALAGVLLRRNDPRWVMLCGFPFLLASGVPMAGFNLDTASRSVVLTMVVQGLGLGFLFGPLTTTTMSGIPAARMSGATGLFNLMRNVGGGVGVSLTQRLLAQAQQLHHLELGRFVNPYTPPTRPCATNSSGASSPKALGWPWYERRRSRPSPAWWSTTRPCSPTTTSSGRSPRRSR